MLNMLHSHLLRLLGDPMLRRDTHILDIAKVRHAEQLVHALKRDALGLGHEEEGDGDHDGAEGAEDEVLLCVSSDRGR